MSARSNNSGRLDADRTCRCPRPVIAAMSGRVGTFAGESHRTRKSLAVSISVSAPGHLPPVRWHRSGGATDDQPCLQPSMLGLRWTPSFDDGQKRTDRLLALSTDRLMDRRERGVDVRGEVDVIEADDADVPGDIESEVTQGAHRADGHGVGHRKDGRRTEATDSM